MALPQWTVKTGSELATIDEKTNVLLPLPLVATEGITVTKIAGQLPPGIRIEDTNLKGVAVEVARTTDFEFVLRASNAEGISDRTFIIRVNGPDAPVWLTPEGDLALSESLRNRYWVDTVNTDWGIFLSQNNVFVKQNIEIYTGIPSRDEGTNGDFAFVTTLQQFWYKTNDRWYRTTLTQLQSALGINTTLQVSSTVPSAVNIDFWFNTNKSNNGLDLQLRYYDDSVPVWRPQNYYIGTTPPLAPFNNQIWMQTYNDSFDFILKIYDDREDTWDILDVTYGNTPPDRVNKAFFVLDSSIVDFQLQAIDNDLTAGQGLYYFIGDDDGELPPGLSLSTDGRITGIVDPLLALDIDAVPGYDSEIYDSNPLDFAVVDDDGYDSYFYDTTFYGFSTPTNRPKKLNRYYNFRVTVRDDVSESKREFRIYVVGDDFLRADNTIMKAGTGLFTADSTYLRKPIWLTPGNLGVKRANNFVTVYLDIFDPNFLLGSISYNIQPFNDDNTPSQLPPGLTLDGLTGELAGIIPYQPTISRDYKFTVEALRQESDTNDVVVVSMGVYEDTLTGKSSLKINKLPVSRDDGISDIDSLVGQNINIDNNLYEVSSVDDTNEDFDVLNLSRPLEPTYKASPLTIFQKAELGDEFLYIKKLTATSENFYKNKVLNYSASEAYTLLDSYVLGVQWSSWVNYQVSISDSAGDLAFNYDASGIEPIPTESTLQETFERYIQSLGIDSGEYEIIDMDERFINFNVISNSTTLRRNTFVSVLSTEDSAEVEVVRSDEFTKVPLDEPLQRTINKDTQISFGTVKDTSLSQRINVTNVEVVSAIKTFTLTVLGDFNNEVTWITDSDLGTLSANRTSYLKLEATSSLADGQLRFTIVEGKLPNGLELKTDGEIVGKARQYSDSNGLGLTTIDNRTTTFDGGNTSFDRKYTFKVLARDRFGYAQNVRTFTISVDDFDSKIYTNIYMQPFPTQTQKDLFNDFINDYNIFTPAYIYRPFDDAFGVKKDLRTLVYAGIENKSIGNFVAAATKNHKKKRFAFGDIKTAVAKIPGTNDIVYEVVYVEIKDLQQPEVGDTAATVKAKNAEQLKINQVKLETKDDFSAQIAGRDIFTITPRDGDVIRFSAEQGQFEIITRDDTVSVEALGQIEIVLQSRLVVVFRSISSTTNESGDPYRFRPRGDVITVDSDAVKSSQTKNVKRYVSNIGNMRKRIKEIGADERQFLPLWMRSSQTVTGQELDYVVAMPICYCKPGTSELVKENIINNGFDFKNINYEIDRYIVETTENNDNEQFILFGNYKFNV